MWANDKTAQQGSQSHAEIPQDPELHSPQEPPAHYCEEHQTDHKRHSRGESVWQTYRTAIGKRCKET